MSRVDRSTLPVPGPDRPFRFPRMAKRRLANGLEVRAIAHHAVPIVSMCVLVPGGSAVDPPGQSGLVSLTAGLLDEGSRGQSAIEVADRVARIGGDLDLDVGADAVVVSLTTLERFFEVGLALVREMVTEPTLAEADFNRVRRLRVERLRQLRDHASAVADRAFAHTVYGTHPYGRLGLGTERSLTSLDVRDVCALHASMFSPDGATLVVTGDRTEAELMDVAEGTFEAWRPAPGTLVLDRAAAVAPPPAQPLARLAVVSRPGAQQSELRIGHACAARSTPDYHALLMLNTILGGQFVSRINLNLREAKGYTYGVRTGFDLRKGLGPFVLQTSVGTDTTADAVGEALREIADIGSVRPATGEEVALGLASVAKGYPRGFETVAQVARSVVQLALHGLADTYFEEFVPKLSDVTPAEVTRVAQQYLDPSKMTTIVVGDLDKIGGSIEQVGLGPPTPVVAEF